MHESTTNGVRVSNQAIYDMLLDVRGEVKSVKQTMAEVITPQLTEQKRRIDTIEIRVYAIPVGLLTAAVAAKAIGLL